jgi:tRNA(Arg) A34 adenosine deaminase TadA
VNTVLSYNPKQPPLAISISLPAWLPDFVSGCSIGHRNNSDLFLPSSQDRVGFAIALAAENCRHGSGGPFGAAIVERESGRLIAPGINLVVASHCSNAHAEMVAIALAQSILGTFNLGNAELPAMELVTSVEPCAMCFGAVPWSGVRSLLCGARDEDARSIGMDEGSKPQDWVKELESRSIVVHRDILRAESLKVLLDYQAGGGAIYNGRS